MVRSFFLATVLYASACGYLLRSDAFLEQGSVSPRPTIKLPPMKARIALRFPPMLSIPVDLVSDVGTTWRVSALPTSLLNGFWAGFVPDQTRMDSGDDVVTIRLDVFPLAISSDARTLTLRYSASIEGHDAAARKSSSGTFQRDIRRDFAGPLESLIALMYENIARDGFASSSAASNSAVHARPDLVAADNPVHVRGDDLVGADDPGWERRLAWALLMKRAATATQRETSVGIAPCRDAICLIIRGERATLLAISPPTCVYFASALVHALLARG